MDFNSPNGRKFDLEERTYLFAQNTRNVIRGLPKKYYLIDDIKQLIRSSGSVAANYIEANEALSKKDFIHRIKICRKEVKESELWLRLVSEHVDKEQKMKLQTLIQESIELRRIFGAIVEKMKKN